MSKPANTPLVFERNIEYAIKKETVEIELPFYGKNDFYHDDQLYVRIAYDAKGDLKETVITLEGSMTGYELRFQAFDKTETRFFECDKTLKEDDFNRHLKDATNQITELKA